MKYLNKYKITSRAWMFMGEFIAESKEEALVQLNKIAGYKSKIDPESGMIVYPDEETERLCGHVEDWIIEEVDEETETLCDQVEDSIIEEEDF
jgi:hypothetical protein